MKTFLAQTTGIGLGTLTLRLIDDTFSWGGVLRGRMELKLEEPTEADGLIVGLRARQRQLSVGRSRSGVKTLGTSSPKLFDFHKSLEGPRLYRTEAFDFALPIPEQPRTPQDVLHPDLVDAVRVVQLLSGQATLPPTWEVYAALQVPWRLNVKAAVNVDLRD